MQWNRFKGNSHHWVLCETGNAGIDGPVLAEVVRNDDGTWDWRQYTSIAEHGVLPGHGREPSRREAQRRANAGLNGHPAQSPKGWTRIVDTAANLPEGTDVYVCLDECVAGLNWECVPESDRFNATFDGVLSIGDLWAAHDAGEAALERVRNIDNATIEQQLRQRIGDRWNVAIYRPGGVPCPARN